MAFIGVFFLLQIFFSLSGKTLFYICLFLAGWYIYANYGLFWMIAYVVISFIIKLIFFLILDNMDLGIYPNLGKKK